MLKTNLLAAALGVSLLVACGSADASRAQTLQVGQALRGEITSGSQLNHNDGSRSQLYQLQLDAGQVVRFSVSGALDATLSLYRDGELIARSQNRGDAVSMAARAPAGGRYQLAVSGIDERAYGPYTVESRLVQTYDGGEVTAGQDISGFVDSDIELPLVITEEAVYDIDLGSDDFDTVLGLTGQGLDLRNDDSQGTDSRITALLKPGRYQLSVGSFGDRHNGLYTLRVAPRQLPADVVVASPGPLQLDAPVTALLVGQPVEYTLDVARGGLLQLDMESSQLDPALTLTGQGLSVEDDDGGEGLNARLRAVVEPGRYVVTARAAMGGDSTGMFTLKAQLGDVPADAGGGRLVVGQERQVRLYGGADSYQLQVAQAGTYVVTMAAADFDSLVEVSRDGQPVGMDDDSGGGLDARLELTLQPGTYQVTARPAMGAANGQRYTIAVRRR